MATTNPTDPNKIRLTGENSFIRLLDDAGREETTRASHWRVLWSPGGTGHVLLLQSELTDNEVQIYSDNIALTRWLQDEIESLLHSPSPTRPCRSSTPSSPGRATPALSGPRR